MVKEPVTKPDEREKGRGGAEEDTSNYLSQNSRPEMALHRGANDPVKLRPVTTRANPPDL